MMNVTDLNSSDVTHWWCGDHGDFIYWSVDGPSDCMLNTFILPLPGIIYFFIVWRAIKRVFRPKADKRRTSPSASILVQLCCIGNVGSIIYLTVVRPHSNAAIYSAVVRCVAWTLACFLVHKEAKRSEKHWPRLRTKVFFVLQLGMTLIAFVPQRNITHLQIFEFSYALLLNGFVVMLSFAKRKQSDEERAFVEDIENRIRRQSSFGSDSTDDSGGFWMHKYNAAVHEHDHEQEEGGQFRKPSASLNEPLLHAGAQSHEQSTSIESKPLSRYFSWIGLSGSTTSPDVACNSGGENAQSVLDKHLGAVEEEEIDGSFTDSAEKLLQCWVSLDEETKDEEPVYLRFSTDSAVGRNFSNESKLSDGNSPLLDRALKTSLNKRITDVSPKGSRDVSNREEGNQTKGVHTDALGLGVEVFRWAVRHHETVGEYSHARESVDFENFMDLGRNSVAAKPKMKKNLDRATTSKSLSFVDDETNANAQRSDEKDAAAARKAEIGAPPRKATLGQGLPRKASTGGGSPRKVTDGGQRADVRKSEYEYIDLADDPNAEDEDGYDDSDVDEYRSANIDEVYQFDKENRGTRTTTIDINSALDMKDKEIEFELTVMPGYKRKSYRGGEQPMAEGMDDVWTLWRTAAEINELHVFILGKMGDLAPRKPKLRTAIQKAGHAISAAELAESSSKTSIKADMHAIKVYIQALLRSPQYVCLECVREFMLLDVHGIPKPRTDSADFQTLTNTNPNLSVRGFGEVASRHVDNGHHSSMLSAEAAQKESHAQKDKWRKVFMQMRIKLKPKAIAVRCRQFNGVISGEEVKDWLVHYVCADDLGTNPMDVGKEFLTSSLILPVTCGYHERKDDVTEEEYRMMLRSDMPQFEPIFEVATSFIYKFPSRSATSMQGSCVLFGGGNTHAGVPVHSFTKEKKSRIQNEQHEHDVQLSDCIKSEDLDDHNKDGKAVYRVNVLHAEESWHVWRFDKDFRYLKDTLYKFGIDVPLPMKLQGTVFAFDVHSVLQSRRKKLDIFIQDAMNMVVASQNQPALEALAEFLDPEYLRLKIIPYRNTLSM